MWLALVKLSFFEHSTLASLPCLYPFAESIIYSSSLQYPARALLLSPPPPDLLLGQDLITSFMSEQAYL